MRSQGLNLIILDTMFGIDKAKNALVYRASKSELEIGIMAKLHIGEVLMG